jgi:hypothetical protein
MKYPTYSMNHATKRFSWPKGVPRRCPLCGAKIKFVGAGQGKLVHTLEGPINEVRNMYVCRNPVCHLHRHWFNPHPRIEYGGRRFGADVFKLVADEILSFKADPGQIFLRLKKTYGVRISLRTVQRMCDDVINLKAFQVDATTRKMLEEDPRVLVVLDGEAADEGTGRGLWLFLDALRNRVLHTCVVESMDHERLHATLETIRARLGITFVGLIGDKQSCITKCHELYYPDLPLQMCQFHFLRNQWKHAEALDSNVFMPLQKAANNLYIHKVAPSATAEFEGKGRLSIREVFKAIDDDLRAMLRARNVPFKRLRGITLYEQLATYVTKMNQLVPKLDPSFRITKIYRQTVESLQAALSEVKVAFDDACLLRDLFEGARKALEDPGRDWVEQRAELDSHYMKVFLAAQEKGLTESLGELRTFQPGKKVDTASILGEWCRLWASYRPGLFQYIHFPKPVRTNGDCETAFSGQKQRIYHRVGKKLVGHMVETRGEAYLRVTHCTEAELTEDILAGVTTTLLKQLGAEQQARISIRTGTWHRTSQLAMGYCDVFSRFYPGWGDLKAEETLG